ncbi:glycosyltransferase involved in cell wall biosynthesis [Leifsonia sp. AK011]|uniref:glycosyltransferase family protein n=1 Tax=Leifsonia sp. AK011 TaxID=2723075 RepID=UPI0015CA986B|nr:glycosyltransferase [Leifsonia sp. AK011]NYF08962.1 glycosyltransferase involved in cell wall biosynthesis [Leifsonia sp. AK011]
MNEDPVLDEFAADPQVISEYEALAAGEYSEGSRGRLLFVVSTTDLSASHGDVYVGLGLAKYLRREGWGITLWPTERWSDVTPEGFDAAIVMIETYVPGLVHPDTAAIAWVRNWTDRWAELPYLEAFAQIWCSSELSATRMREAYPGPVEVLPLATDPELFSPVDVPRDRGVVTTANYWGSDRGLFASLALVAATEPVTWFGRNMPYLTLPEGIDHSRRVDYFALPAVYSAWNFVIDDAIPAARDYGAQNSRLFDALACGAAVITNNTRALDELDLDEVLCYDEPEELPEVLRTARADPEAHAALTARLRDVVLGQHTYAQRAAAASVFLERAVAASVNDRELLAWTSRVREQLRTMEIDYYEIRGRLAQIETDRDALRTATEELRYWYDLSQMRVAALESEAANHWTRRVGYYAGYVKSPRRIVERLRRSSASATPPAE